jgi:hypothetical protein
LIPEQEHHASWQTDEDEAPIAAIVPDLECWLSITMQRQANATSGAILLTSVSHQAAIARSDSRAVIDRERGGSGAAAALLVADARWFMRLAAVLAKVVGFDGGCVPLAAP